MRIELPAFCLVALIGASGSGKSTFAARHFKATEVLSSDFFRGLVSDDEQDKNATASAFDSLYYVAGKRLEAGKLTVIDATSVQKTARAYILQLAKEQNCFSVAIVLDMPTALCQERNRLKADRADFAQVAARHSKELQRSLKYLGKEGFRYVHVLRSQEEVDAVEITRVRLWNDKRDEHGPFDVIGDIHGCYDELCALLEKLGYAVDKKACLAVPPVGRKVIFLGDLCDRGPENIKVLQLVMSMTKANNALCLPGNHDTKLLRALQGAKVTRTHGLDITLNQLQAQPPEFSAGVKAFLESLVSHYVLDDGKLVVAHAGLKEKLQGRSSGAVRDFCLYGETTGESDEFGLPIRHNWAEAYRGKALVLYGHVPSLAACSQNNTICLDTGCVFGGKLTACRYPEKTLVEVNALREYYQPVKSLQSLQSLQVEAERSAPAGTAGLLNIRDVMENRQINTRLCQYLTIPAENAAAALENMGRFAADPRWLLYLPPTMSPCETSTFDGYLEHPLEAFNYYKKQGVQQLVCEEKHMGSRAIIVLCRDKAAAQSRFGVDDGSIGLIYTRTGRPFFDGAGVTVGQEILARLQEVLSRAGFWERFATNWICLDCELMPWSAKAGPLLTAQYAPVGFAGRAAMVEAQLALQAIAAQQKNTGEASGKDVDIKAALALYQSRQVCLERYIDAYRRYCRPVHSIDDYRIAPFHILATEGKVWNDETHVSHLENIKNFLTADPLFMATENRVVELGDDNAVASAVDWWMKLTAAGGEGMVVKPMDFIVQRKKRVVQPAIKCRGREYLRIIYGPEYTLPQHLERLKQRSLEAKRRLALREFALGMEALELFVNKEPLYRVHRCVFGVLALESEPVDPRL